MSQHQHKESQKKGQEHQDKEGMRQGADAADVSSLKKEIDADGQKPNQQKKAS